MIRPPRLSHANPAASNCGSLPADLPSRDGRMPQDRLMPSLTTLYRAVVMVAVSTMVYQGWKHFGPSTEQVKSIGVQAVELMGRAWKEVRPPATGQNLALDPRGNPLQPAAPAAAPSLMDQPSLPPHAASGVANNNHHVADSQMAAPPLAPAPVAKAEQQNSEITPIPGPGGKDERLKPLYSRLEQLGAHDAQLKPWGTSGQFFRFRCSASLADSPELSRHFESVATEPAAAVQEVVAAIDAWRTAQRQEATQIR